MSNALSLSRELPPNPQIAPEWSGWLDEDDLQALLSHPLLVRLESGRATRRDLRCLLLQQHYYSRYFTRFLCAMISNLASPKEVHTLAQNLSEELGLDRRGALSHAALFLRTLDAVGAEPGGAPVLPETQALVDAMFTYCRSPDALDGLSALCLGAEAIVPILYQPILRAMDDLNIAAESKAFFVIHIAEDDGHAGAMLQLLAHRAPPGSPQRARAAAIGSDMIRHRMRFLDAIFQQVSTPAEIQ